MAIQYEDSGTVNLTNGSTTVTGVGTNWLIDYPGVTLNVGGLSFAVSSIDSRTQMTLNKPYPGDTATGVTYTLLPLQAENYQLSKKVQEVLDVAGELVDATVGPQGPAGPLGPPGPAGKNGDAGFGAIVNFSEYKPMPAGSPGVYMLVPVVQGEPGVTLSQRAQVILPANTPNMGIGLYLQVTTSGNAIAVLGLTNAPEPQPEMPGEDIDLGGSGAIFGAPNSVFSLGISVADRNAAYNVTLPSGLPFVIRRVNSIATPVASQWRMGTTGAPYPVTGNAVDSSIVMNKVGPASAFGFRNNNVVINSTNESTGGYLTTPAIAAEFPTTSSEQTTETPARIRVSFKGVVPAGSEGGVLASLMDYQVGEFRLEPYWDGPTLKVILGRNGSNEDVISDPSDARVLGTNQLYEAEWTNDPGGDGGTMRFFIDGVQMGAPKTTSTKPRITPKMPIEIGASSGNTSVGVPGLEVEYVAVSFDKPGSAESNEPAASGPISVGDLEALAADARNVAAPGPYQLTYRIGSGEPFTLVINIGEMALPAGRAYKAVLEDWSSGSGVPHPSELVMTRVATQNCRFEDDDLFNAQASWTEVLPQGPVPNINGINYYCEGIRMGTYVQFQFIYDWDESQMPANPFGDPTNKESYMIPHKWMIYDNTGQLIHRIEQPNGEPLNNTARPPVFEGPFSNGIPVITPENRWLPHGTVRSSVIWRSHEPVAYDQQRIWNTVPTFDARAPFACFSHYSVNGGDARLFSDGQHNGFANYRVMPWEPSDNQTLLAQAAATQSPYKLLFKGDGVEPNAGIWLRYTPFNSMGRSPITGPGGVRDDRQLMPDMVAAYARDVNSTRAFDNHPMKAIALDYLTGYASDPVHGMEGGRCKPLYKSNARRNIRLREHYYGYGEASVPPTQAWYAKGGRTYEWMAGSNPLRVRVPRGGNDPKKPIFGTFMVDRDHAHQYPHWGSLLFQTPEFAMLGHKHSDQARLYANHIIGESHPGETSNRGGAWAFIHAILMWKTASTNSSRLYSRAEVLDWVVTDFEVFYDNHMASTPGFLNPPSNIYTNGRLDGLKAMYAADARFGMSTCSTEEPDRVYNHDFMIGYWLSALHAGHKLGFNQALSAASPKAKAVIDWLKLSHRKRIVGRLTQGSLINAEGGTEYMTALWTAAQISAANGNVAQLPQNYQQVSDAQARKSPSWDTCHDENGNVISRDGQSLDQFLAGPGLLLDMGMTGADLESAAAIAEQRLQQKLNEEVARGPDLAGQGHFLFHQATNNRPYKPS